MNLFSRNPPGPIAPAGLHHYRRGSARIHLRVGRDGSGVLAIDASKIVHLNRTACDIAWLVLEGVPRREAVKRIRSLYRTGPGRAGADIDSVGRAIDAFLDGGSACPVEFLGLDRLEPFSMPVEAPFRADLALTYRCNVDCLHCYNGDRESTELSTDSWRRIMGILWDAGVPHAAFTGGEATLRDDLPDLIAHAESLGMVAGLLTNGVRLAERSYLDSLAGAGLDYVQITLESPEESVHDGMTRSDSFARTVEGLRNTVAAGMYAITNTTLTRLNAATAAGMPGFLKELGVGAFAMNSIIHSGRGPTSGVELSADETRGILLRVKSEADRLGMRMIWYSPTRYCDLDPVSLGLGPKRCTAGQYNICVEPDGSVIPCQSYYMKAGNLLTDSWDSIYNSSLFRSIRDRDRLGEECTGCPDRDLCGGGCPLPAGGSGVACPDMLSNP